MEKVAIFEGRDSQGNLFLTQFIRDYKNTFNITQVNVGCLKCLNDYYNKFINHLSKMENKKNKSKFQLKKKYQGIQLKFGSSIFVKDSNMTDEYGYELLNKHPHGAKLFDKYPKTQKATEAQEKAPEVPGDESLTLTELRAKYPGVKATSKKVFLAKL